MPNFKLYSQKQALLLPVNLADCLPKDHMVFMVNEVVDGLDLSMIENTYSPNGSPAYNPRLMIKILFYGHTQGIASSRKIEQATYDNNAFRFLSANTQPDHGTISLFRQKHLQNLPSIFAQIVILCGRLDMADLSDISIDGTKIKASASRSNLLDQERIDKLQKRIGEYLKEAISLDEEEDKRFGNRRGYNQLSEEMADPEKRKKAIEEAKAKLEKIKLAGKRIKAKQKQAKTSEEKKLSKNSSSNTTDPEANLMKMKNGAYKMAYNVQLSTADQVITGYDVTDNPVDEGELQNMVQKTEQTTDLPVNTLKADAGYFSKEDILFCEQNNIDAYIPDQLKAVEEKQERDGSMPEFDRKNFHYEPESDSFICPQGKRLKLKEKYGGRGKYLGTECQTCPVKAKCTKGRCRYLYYDPELEEKRKAMRAKLDTEEGKKKYLERMPEIEPVYGNLKQNLGFTEFKTRGKPMVLIETGLYCIAHNLVKIFNHLKREEKKGNKIQLNALMRLQAVD